jgi:cytochrome c biogenesis protein CcdA/thiol-disulfide isomerase/thioredoxin
VVILLGFAFLSGLVTVLAPCVWPLLPIILSVTAGSRGRDKPLGITLGLMGSFGILTLGATYLFTLFHLNTNVLRMVAIVVIGWIGVTMLIPKLAAISEGWLSRLTAKFGGKQIIGNDFKSGLLTGAILGLVWTPCAGPILAAIASLSALSQVNLNVVLVTLFYVTGIGIPLFILAYGGQEVINNTRWLSKYTGRIQQMFGGILILAAIAIYTNFDTYLQAQLLNAFPWFNAPLSSLENSGTVKQQLDILKGKNPSIQNPIDQSGILNTNYPAPELKGGTKWLNTLQGPSLQDLRGKVVLVDFWTYTCINCIRTLPFVTAWYEKYKDMGFTVIGVHTPEFQFERDTNNVIAAAKRYNIQYPIVQDNNYAIWGAYNNQYWPAEYLIDSQGQVRRTHFGEGEYDKMETAIQKLLTEAGNSATSSGLVNVIPQSPQTRLSPETYLGSERMEYYYPGGSTGNAKRSFILNEKIPVNTFSLGGNWTIKSENAITGDKAVLIYHFQADKVYLVLRPGTAVNPKVKVNLDNKLDQEINIDSDRLYTLIDLNGNPGEHVLRLDFSGQGIEAYAFTFG